MQLSQGDILVPPSPGAYKLRVRSLYFPNRNNPDPQYVFQLYTLPPGAVKYERKWMSRKYDLVASWSELQDRGFVLEKKQPQQLSLFASQGCSD